MGGSSTHETVLSHGVREQTLLTPSHAQSPHSWIRLSCLWSLTACNRWDTQVIHHCVHYVPQHKLHDLSSCPVVLRRHMQLRNSSGEKGTHNKSYRWSEKQCQGSVCSHTPNRRFKATDTWRHPTQAPSHTQRNSSLTKKPGKKFQDCTASLRCCVCQAVILTGRPQPVTCA